MGNRSQIIRRHLQDFPAPTATWVDYLPSKIRPYFYLARVHRPSGILLLFYPCAWSVTMTCYTLGAPMTTAWTYLGFFLVASQVFCATGCIIDDMWDKDIDAATSRTRKRPLAAGDLSMLQAFVFLILHLTFGIWLFMQLNAYRYVISHSWIILLFLSFLAPLLSLILGLSSLVLVVLYPTMKRVIDWPQAVLGMCFSWGSFLGTASVAGTVDWHIYIPLYMGSVCWTIVYDTCYARQDRDEDIINGVHSTAVVFGDQIRPILVMFSCVLYSLVSYAGILNGHSVSFFIGVTLGARHLIRLIARIDFENEESCDAVLINNTWFGFWVWAGAMVDYVVKMQS
ncbi:4-hydroxybenzoate polyprenyl transferase [Suillus subaureus]|uniref:4-hydroxybenzoate polyprenyltransferase, mitochondrial n=1 Tax=Suillus subaureus TaxID=48587 RepID=A0A9P7JDN4_9AGAM|nr:4-hydroxybenzoate polyprenyl transferase [Suillus subaureus]KAG1816462.1 4-hydroxybenzoate polyprenyl transferase [Suillus subaureus]